MAIRVLKAKKKDDGTLMVIFSGGGKLAWYPTKEELLQIIKELLSK